MPTPVPLKWIRTPADHIAIAEGCTFDASAGEFVCDFIETFCCQSKGQWGGKPVELIPWERDFLMRLYGWKRPDGTRRFRTAYLEIPKKNGKSTLLSCLGIVHLVADDEPAPEAYVCACDKSQAGIIYEESSRMVAKSPDLKKRVESIPSKKLLVFHGGEGKLEALSADVPSKDGLNASLVVFDELHRQQNGEMYAIMKYAGASRRQPLHIDITTAGEDEKGVWHERRVYSEQVNDGLIPDTSHLGVVYRCDPKTDDFDDPKTWAKANPSLGFTIRLEDFQREHAAAKKKPRDWANFLRLRLGVIVHSSVKFIEPDRWRACVTAHAKTADQLAGRVCFGGLDLATTTDLAAQVLFFPDGHGFYDTVWRIWCPEETASEREREDQVPYRMWADQGFITLTPGDVIDYDFIEAQIEEDARLFDLRKLFADPYNATQLCLSLQAKGIPVEFIRQGFLSLSAPTKELERLTLTKHIRVPDNPVVHWCINNCVTEQDAAGNIKLSKRKSKERIDPAAAAVNAVAAFTSSAPDEESVYNSRGLLLI